ncbi:MAG: FprA family A-type flavoprotein [Acidaminococcaceae bacterium]|nr:FprA family A-type flavoprotein [Acidaminococcaceae bacterium]
MKPQELVKDIFDVGIIDWTMQDFHGFYTPHGVTYNSYLIMAEKICLIDTVKAVYSGEFLDNIKKIIDPKKIDCIIINHVEPDHSGSMPAIAAACPNAKFYISRQGKGEAIEHYGDIFDFEVVKAGDSLSLGNKTLQFIPVPMLHWPDSMITYLVEDKILFSNDAFGQHYCTSKRFDDEVDTGILYYEVKKYFANILLPYAKLIGNALKTVNKLDLQLIAPGHGCIWRSHIKELLAKYEEWGKGTKSSKLIIVYDTMWGGTEAMARAITRGASSAGITVKLFRYDNVNKSDIAAELLTAGGILFGSPTQNSGMMPNLGGLFTYLKGLKPIGKKAAAFGTLGWSGGAQKDMEEFMIKAGLEVETGYNCKWRPRSEEILTAEQFGYDFAQKLK